MEHLWRKPLRLLNKLIIFRLFFIYATRSIGLRSCELTALSLVRHGLAFDKKFFFVVVTGL